MSLTTNCCQVLFKEFGNYNLSLHFIVLGEWEWALLGRYVYTYEEFVIVTEAPQCNRMTAKGQDTYYKIIIYK